MQAYLPAFPAVKFPGAPDAPPPPRSTPCHTPCSCLRAPDVLVQLQVQPDRQPVAQQPVHQLTGVQLAVHQATARPRSGRPGTGSGSPPPPSDSPPRPSARTSPRPCETGRPARPSESGGSPPTRGLHVHDPDHLGGQLVDRVSPGGLDHHPVGLLEQQLGQGHDLALEHRLAAGQQHQGSPRRCTSAAICDRVMSLPP